MNPNNFILNTDYATLKNDDKATVTLYLGGTSALAYGESYTYSNTVTVGSSNAPIRCQMSTDVAPTVIVSSPQIQVILEATTAGTPYPYPATVYVERTDATTITIKCHVYGNVPGQTVQITGDYQTVTANIVTFLSPFN